MTLWLSLFLVPAVVLVAWLAVGWWQKPGWRARIFYGASYLFCIVGIGSALFLWNYHPSPLADASEPLANSGPIYGLLLGVSSFASILETALLWLVAAALRRSPQYRPPRVENTLPRI